MTATTGTLSMAERVAIRCAIDQLEFDAAAAFTDSWRDLLNARAATLRTLLERLS